MRHLDNLVLKNGIIAGLLCAALIFGLGWTGWVLYPLKLGRIHADKNVEYAAALLNLELDRAERTTHGLKALWLKEPIDMRDPTRFEAIQPFLENAGLPLNILLSRANAETLLIIHRSGVWNMELIPSGEEGRTIYRAQHGKWVPEEPASYERTFRAMDRPWYQAAEASETPSWTEPYRFSPGNSGYSFVAPLRQGDQLKGVVGVDVTLANLGTRLRELLPSSEYRILLTDPLGRILVPSDPAPAATPLVREAGLLIPPTPEALAAFTERGPFRYQCQFALRDHAPFMNLRVAISPDTLVPGLRLRIWLVGLAAVLAFAAVMGYALFLNRNLVQPITRLLRQDAPDDTTSEIWEFRQMEDSLRRLGQTELDRQQILRQLEHAQRVETMGNMAPGVIHDLNNHLSVVLAQLNLCHEQAAELPALTARIAKAERATMRCAQAMRGLLEYSRPSRPEPVEFQLNELVQSTVSLLEPVLGETIRVETYLAEGIPPLQGETVKLQQVLVNLALNARDAMRGCGTLSVHTGEQDGHAFVEVKDTGSGMTEDVRAKLFDPFFTTKGPGKGTGLGLTMVHRIITAHGGSILVDTVLGEGTRFAIRLPILAACPAGEIG
jgi:signal transduction histidine kinase